MAQIRDDRAQKIREELHTRYQTGVRYLSEEFDEADVCPVVVNDFAEQFNDVLLPLLSYAANALPEDCFPCIVNRADERNAVAEKIHDTPVIEVYLPLIADCLARAHSYAMFNDYLTYKSPIVRYSHTFRGSSIDEDGNISFDSPADISLKKFANSIAYLSVKWILLHEAAHHRLEHLAKTKEGKLKACGNDSANVDGLALQHMETEADAWAVLRLLKDFDEIHAYFSELISAKLKRLDTIKIIYLAVALPLMDVDSSVAPEHLQNADHPPEFIRLASITSAFVSFFGIAEGIDNGYWQQIKKELAKEYKRNSFIKDDLFERAGHRFNIGRSIRKDDTEVNSLLLHNWLLESYAYIIVRYCDMMGCSQHRLIAQDEAYIARVKQLNADGVQTEHEMTFEIDKAPPSASY